MIIPEKDTIRDVLSQSPLEPVTDQFVTLSLSAARLGADRDTYTNRTNELPTGTTSWAEGTPRMTADVEWPRSDTGPMDLLAQIDLASLPALEDWPNQPTSGALLFFRAADWPDGGGADGAVRFVASPTGPLRPMPPDYTGTVGTPNARGTTIGLPYPIEMLESGFSPPPTDDPTLVAACRDSGVEGYPANGLSAASPRGQFPLLQILGQPDTVQFHPFEMFPTIDRPRLLAQHCIDDLIDHFVIGEADLAAGRFDQAQCTVQC